MIEDTKAGGRRVFLYLPYNGVEAITFGPWKLDHTLKWREGKFGSALALMVALSEETEATLRELREPDATRVLNALMDLVPAEIKEDMVAGTIPGQGIEARRDPDEEEFVPEPPVVEDVVGDPLEHTDAPAPSDSNVLGFDLGEQKSKVA